MKVSIEPGKYVIAVSGGVDSTVLLDVLARQHKVELVIAHFDHSIRKDSVEDRLLVQVLADKYGLPFVFNELKLGSNVSEAKAREKRYEFLRSVQKQYQAKGIITAHHQDDVLETAVLNLLRGTNRRGLSSLKSTASTKRPLLDVPKSEIIDYAKSHNLKWREDSTNLDDKYLRNYIRHQILPHFKSEHRQQLLTILSQAKQINQKIDDELSQIFLNGEGSRLDRQWFLKLPHATAKDIMAAWLRYNNVRNINRSSLDRLVVAAKTLPPSKTRHVDVNYNLKITKKYLALLPSDR